MQNQDKRSFEDVVRSIAASEEDVDKVLEASRLSRNEGPSTKMTGSQKMELLLCSMGALAIISLFVVIGILCKL